MFDIKTANLEKIQPKLNIIKWVDHSSFSENTWRDIAVYADGDTFVVFTVGWVVYEDKDVVVLLSTAARESSKGFGDMKILKKAIVNRWELNDPSTPKPKRKANRSSSSRRTKRK
jgi:hypothetical protein